MNNATSFSYKALIEHFAQFTTPERFAKMKQVLANRTRHIVPVLEHVNKPENVSAAMRSVEAFGLQNAYVIDQHRRHITNPQIAKGGYQWLDVKHYCDKDGSGIIACLEELKKQNYTIYATTPHTKEVTIHTLPLDSKVAIVFGNEIRGISDTIKQHADGFVVIPMYGFMESFNISVSVALTLYELTTRLRNSSISWQLSPSEKNQLLYHWLKSQTPGANLIEQRFLQNK